MDEERVVVADRTGRAAGTIGKLAAHVAPGVPHLAFSLMIIRPDGAFLLQRRAPSKHHFRGLWSNSCCSHPRPGEGLRAAAARRAREELGLTIDSVEVVGSFWYRAEDPDSGLVEHEYDTVLKARCQGTPALDPNEVSDLAWRAPADVRLRCSSHPATVTPWLPAVMTLLGSTGPP